MSQDKLRGTVANHPRLTGALFSIMLIASQVGTVAAEGSGGFAG